MLGHLIRRLQQISSSIFAQHMKAAGTDLTSPQFAALAMISDHSIIDQATLEGADVLSSLRPVVEVCQDAILPSLTAEGKAEFIRLAVKIAASENEQSRARLLEIAGPKTKE